MSRRRYLSTDISTDKRVNRLARDYGDFAALLYTWMIPHAGNDGALSGDPEEILMQVVPGRRDKSIEDVEAALAGMAALGLIAWDWTAQSVHFPASFYKFLYRRQSSLVRKGWDRVARKMRPAVFARDGANCQKCGSTERLEIDHIQPLSRGGTNDLGNLQVLCLPCNRSKGAR